MPAAPAPPTTVRVRAPLKLVLAGEYAVLEPGASGISAAVDRSAACTAEPGTDGLEIRAPGLCDGVARAEIRADGALAFTFPDPQVERRLHFVRRAAEVAHRYVAEIGLAPRPLRLLCESDEGQMTLGTGEVVKLGLGTSAGTCVAASAAILAAHGVPIDRPSFRRAFFRLALIAHTRAQDGRGSGIDVASSAHGGLLEYRRGDARWLSRADTSPLELVRGPWPGQHVEALPIPHGMRLLAGFTGRAAVTTDLVAAVESWKAQRPERHEQFVTRSQRACKGLSLALKKGDRDEIFDRIRKAREALRFLASETALPIETPQLVKLAEVADEAGAAGKLSGAGGGDCGYAIAFDEATAVRIEEGWRAAGIVPLRLEVAPRGVREEGPAESGKGSA